jgi:hypothetical protein
MAIIFLLWFFNYRMITHYVKIIPVNNIQDNNIPSNNILGNNIRVYHHITKTEFLY